MTAAEVSDAIAALDAAASALRRGHLTIPEQLALATKCNDVAHPLRQELWALKVEVTA